MEKYKLTQIEDADDLKTTFHMVGAMDILDQIIYHQQYTELMKKIDENWSTQIDFIDIDKNRQLFYN